MTTGCGAAGTATTKIRSPRRDAIVGCDEGGVIYRGREASTGEVRVRRVQCLHD